MPICYEIDIQIVGVNEDGSEYITTLPRRLVEAVPISREQIAERIGPLFFEWMMKIFDYDPSIQQRYPREVGFEVTSIIDC